MRQVITRGLAALFVAAGFSTSVFAADELAVFVFKDGNPAEGLTAALDGEIEKPVNADGSVFFDLSSGAHILGIFDGRKLVFSKKFDSVPGDLADATVNIVTFEQPVGSIQTYSRSETPGERAKAPRGRILGRITDVATGDPVAGAIVTLQGSNLEAVTDPAGNYTLLAPRGVYTLVIDAGEYGQKSFENTRVVTNIDRGVSYKVGERQANDTGFRPPAPVIEEIFVVARYQPTALGEDERYSSGLVDTLGIGELSRFGGSDVSQSVIRIPSVTVKDGRFVFVRGLGGRYITTTLNGALLPSTDPSKRTVPLDLFPTNFVSQLDVKKQFIASMPGESTGGNLVINTRKYPAESAGRLSIQVGAVQGLTGETVIADPLSGDFDYLGVDDGERFNNGFFQSITDAITLADSLGDQQAVAAFSTIGGNALLPGLDLGEATARPKLVLGGSYGRSWEFGEDSEWGFFGAANYRNEWSQRTEGIDRTYGGDINQGTQTIRDDFVFEEASNTVEASGLFNLGLSTGNSSYTSNTLFSRSTLSRARQDFGVDGDSTDPSIRHLIDYIERQFISQQFTGDHVFGAREQWVLDWQFTASQANRDAPGRAQVRFDLQNNSGIFNLQVPELSKRYDELEDRNYDLSGDIEYALPSSDEDETKVSTGVQIIRRERDATSDNYGYFVAVNGDNSAPNLLVTDVINPSTMTGDPQTGFGFQNKTLATDSYDATLDLDAIYVAFDSLQNDTHQFLLGVRYEDYKQLTNTFNLQTGDPLPAPTEDDVWLPSVGYNWFFTENQTLRFGVSKTVSRPDFKETSNAVFFDQDFNFNVRGNPNLQVSEAVNADIRYQFYWDDVDNLSFGIFYKDLDKPIERVLNLASGSVGNSRTFQNAKAAEVYGLEFEGRKEWSLFGSLSKSFFVAANASWIESEVELVAQANSTRALQGQPEYVVNLIFGYDDIDNGQELTILLNQNGDTIADVGVNGQADVILEPRLDLIVNYRWYFADAWQLVVKGENLLDEPVEFTQAGNIFQSWKTGRELTLGVNLDF